MITRNGLRVLVSVILIIVPGSFAATLGEAVDAVATNLVQNQVPIGLPEWKIGYWPDAEAFTGTITEGLVSAYHYTGNAVYAQSALNAASYMHLLTLAGRPVDDIVLAFAQIGTSGTGPSNWLDEAAVFFEKVRTSTGGAAGYIDAYQGLDASSVIYYLSQLTIAAHLVDTEDMGVWRKGLIDALGRVNDESALFPVQAIGIATWALADTGPLDDTLIVSDENDPVWGGIALSDLPSVLQGHQVPQAGYDDPGSFFWRLDHGDSGQGYTVSGYFEDAVYCTLGLYSAATQSTTQAAALEESIVNGVKAILSASAVDGMVYEHLTLGGQTHLVYDAEWLIFVDSLGLDPNLDMETLSEMNEYTDLGMGYLLME